MRRLPRRRRLRRGPRPCGNQQLPLPPPSPPPPLTPAATTTVHERGTATRANSTARRLGRLHPRAARPSTAEGGRAATRRSRSSAARRRGSTARNAVGWPTPIRSNTSRATPTSGWRSRTRSPTAILSPRLHGQLRRRKAMREGAALPQAPATSKSPTRPSASAPRPRPRTRRRRARRTPPTLGGPSYQKQNPEEVWAGQGEKMGKATTQHRRSTSPPPPIARRGRGRRRQPLLWLGDGRAPPQMSRIALGRIIAERNSRREIRSAGSSASSRPTAAVPTRRHETPSRR